MDLTNKPITKQLCNISKEGEILINGESGVMKRHFVHRKCKTLIKIEGDRIRCTKCNQIIPTKSISYWSNLVNGFLRNDNISIGEALLDNIDYKILIVDMEYVRRGAKNKRQSEFPEVSRDRE